MDSLMNVKVFESEKAWLSYSAFYPVRNVKYWSLYYLTGFVSLFITCADIISMVTEGIMKRNDLKVVVAICGFLITQCSFLVKWGIFVVNGQKMIEIEDMLKETTFTQFTREQKIKFQPELKKTMTISKIYVITAYSGVMFFILPTLFFGGNEKKLSTPHWYPWNTQDYFVFSTLFESLSTLVSIHINSRIDTLAWKLMNIADVQCGVLKDNLENIPYEENCSERLLKNSIQHYISIRLYTIKFMEIMSVIIFAQFTSSVGIICLTGFELLTADQKLSLDFFFVLTYSTCMMCQLFMYCWYGHSVKHTSNQIVNSFYMSNWYQSDLKLRKTMLIFTEIAKNPIELVAGKMFTLSLETFIAIIKSSYSYFVVLQQMYELDQQTIN